MSRSGSDDPFRLLGLTPEATLEQVAAARRRLAKSFHPDAGGGHDDMQRLNEAATRAEALIAERSVLQQPARGRRERRPGTRRERPRPAPGRGTVPSSLSYDEPSFTIEALPAVAFEALTRVAGDLGVVAEDDPPYLLVVDLTTARRDRPGVAIPVRCFLTVVPDAGASTVSLAVAQPQGAGLAIETIRDVWIEALNHLDWSGL